MWKEETILFRGKIERVVYQDNYAQNKTINFGFSGFFPTSILTVKELEEIHNQLLTKLGYSVEEPKLSPYYQHIIMGMEEED